MANSKRLFAILWLLFAATLHAQQPDTGLLQSTTFVSPLQPTLVLADTTPVAAITAREYFSLLGNSASRQVTAPFRATAGEWGAVARFAVVGGLLAFADEPLQQWAVQLKNTNGTVRTVSRQITHLGGPYELYTLAALGSYGFLFRDQKMKNTVLLSTQAFAISGVMARLLKAATGRRRPYYLEPHTTEAEPKFEGPFYKQIRVAGDRKVNNSFPSGHTTVAFAVATVFATEYRNKPWVPAVAYSAATLVGLSRITENKHWATDVFAGALLGYFSGRSVSRTYHRHLQQKAAKKRIDLSFNVQYLHGRLLPGMLCRF